MSMFTLAISCLTSSNLLWFIDVTFQVPMQYCSFQHQTLLSPPDTSKTEHHFHFGPATSFFLELLVIALTLPQHHTGHLPTCVAHLPLPYLLAFSSCSWGSHSKNTGVVCHSLLQWTTFCQAFPPWPVHLGWPHTAWLSFIGLAKAVVCMIRLARWLEQV